MKTLISILLITYVNLAISQSNIWSEDYKLPGNQKCFVTHEKKVCLSDSDRSNVFNQEVDELDESIKRGSSHALFYPVTVSALQVPYDSLTRFFSTKTKSAPFLEAKFISLDSVYKWVGLHKYPEQRDKKSPNIIYNMHKFDNERMGATISSDNKNVKKLTFGCAACHSSNLFGTKILGMTNRFPKSNEFFVYGKKAIAAMHPTIFKITTRSSKNETLVYKEARDATKYIDLKKPLVLGLDTSLAQVGLSLATRADDKYASRVKIKKRFNQLQITPADSKPAVWWNLKYKTKWLSDGSIRSGNPVHTNFLWNEIGRGTDLKKLESWLLENDDIINDLTSFVFNSKSPKYDDFFPNTLNIEKAKRGQSLYRKNCIGCHGDYEKGWEFENSDYKSQISTTKTWYHTKTITIDVKTDPHRYEGMRYFYKDLNKLQISKSIGTVVAPQVGYVPPPLVGIWARWPYLHNNSVPTLYDMLTPDNLRAKKYYAVDAIDKEKDFDKIKNGYPTIKNKKKYLFDTTKEGLSNKGHSFMLVDQYGEPKFNHTQKLEIIEFLKTL